MTTLCVLRNKTTNLVVRWCIQLLDQIRALRRPGISMAVTHISLS